MEKPCFLLDSNIIISHLNNDLNLFTFLNPSPLYEVYASRIAEIETLSKPGMTAEEEAKARSFISCFKKAAFDDTAIEIAIRIRRTKVLKLPDALIASAAIALNAIVLSNDPHLYNFQWPGYTAEKIPFTNNSEQITVIATL